MSDGFQEAMNRQGQFISPSEVKKLKQRIAELEQFVAEQGYCPKCLQGLAFSDFGKCPDCGIVFVLWQGGE